MGYGSRLKEQPADELLNSAFAHDARLPVRPAGGAGGSGSGGPATVGSPSRSANARLHLSAEGTPDDAGALPDNVCRADAARYRALAGGIRTGQPEPGGDRQCE